MGYTEPQRNNGEPSNPTKPFNPIVPNNDDPLFPTPSKPYVNPNPWYVEPSREDPLGPYGPVVPSFPHKPIIPPIRPRPVDHYRDPLPPKPLIPGQEKPGWFASANAGAVRSGGLETPFPPSRRRGSFGNIFKDPRGGAGQSPVPPADPPRAHAGGDYWTGKPDAGNPQERGMKRPAPRKKLRGVSLRSRPGGRRSPGGRRPM
jgi:hypothetical protein